MIKFKILEEYLKYNIILKETNGIINIECNDNLTKQYDSNYYNMLNVNCNLIINIDILPCLETSENVLVCDIDYIGKNKKERYSCFYGSTILSSHPKFDEWKDEIKSISYFAIEKTSKNVILTYGKESVSKSNYYTLNKFQDIITKRVKYLYKYKLVLESNKLKNKVEIPKLKPIIFKDYTTKKFIEHLFTIEEIQTIKEFIKLYKNKINGPFDLIEKIHLYFKLTQIKNSNYSIDNGWGSYTYTTIWYPTDISKISKKVISYLVWYFQNKFEMVTKDHRMVINNTTIGMVQNSGGYTHVSG